MRDSFLSLPSPVPGEALLLITACVCFVFIWGAFRFFPKDGLVVYIVLGAVVSNLQVLKTAVAQLTSEPFVLGTVVFTSLFWAMEVITEYEGPAAARKALILSLLAPLLVLVWMWLALLHEPFPSVENLNVQRALEILFLPAPGLFLSSIVAYFCSQWVDIWLFALLKKTTQGAYLGARAAFVACVSGFLDNALFSLLAWKVFAIQPISWHHLFWTYMVGAYGIRALVSLGAGPLLHCIRRTVPKLPPPHPHTESPQPVCQP